MTSMSRMAQQLMNAAYRLHFTLVTLVPATASSVWSHQFAHRGRHTTQARPPCSSRPATQAG
jgi:hypothetical protein